jgi:parallel beta-helix repeat protein
MPPRYRLRRAGRARRASGLVISMLAVLPLVAVWTEPVQADQDGSGPISGMSTSPDACWSASPIADPGAGYGPTPTHAPPPWWIPGDDGCSSAGPEPTPTTAPTAAPTPPTAAPTVDPTSAPTTAPTPTAAPTAVPTAAPTPKPTAAPPSTSGPITVTKDGVTIDGVTITGSGSGSGIKAVGTASNPISDLTIRNCTIKGFTIGIDVQYVENLVIEDCTIDNSVYAGIMVISGIGGRISDNTIRKVGYYTPLNTGYENNAYGIALTRIATTNFTANPRTSDFVVDGNTIEDVPYWHCLDTHAGERITFSNNITRRCPRPIFVTTDGIVTMPKNITVTGNRLEQGIQVSGGTNMQAITIVNLRTGSITGNAVSSTFDTPYVYDYKGLDPSGSLNVTISGNTTIQ